VLLTQAFRRKFVIPDFMSFTSHIDELYESAKKQSGGKVTCLHIQLQTSVDFLTLTKYIG